LKPRQVKHRAVITACLREVTRSEEVEVAPDGTVVRTVYVEISPFGPAAAIKAIKELNAIDGDHTVKQRARCMW
jgi:hypothetical protein